MNLLYGYVIGVLLFEIFALIKGYGYNIMAKVAHIIVKSRGTYMAGTWDFQIERNGHQIIQYKNEI